jgi:hypothetical protein
MLSREMPRKNRPAAVRLLAATVRQKSCFPHVHYSEPSTIVLLQPTIADGILAVTCPKRRERPGVSTKRLRIGGLTIPSLKNCLGLGIALMLCAQSAQAAVAFRAAASAGIRTPTISFRAVGTVASAASGNITPTLSVELNALLICVVEQHDNVAISFPAGWSQLYSLSSTATHRASVFYKASAAAEANPLITHTGGNAIIAQCATFRGADAANPLDVAQAAQYAASSASVASGGLTTVTANDMMLYAMHIADNPTITVAPGGTGGVTWTQRFYNSTALGLHSAAGLYTGTKAAAGAVGPIAATISAASENHGVLLALHNGSVLSIKVPIGTAAGDVMIAAVTTTPSSVPITAPAGWTLIQAVTQATATSNRVSTYYRVAGVAEPSAYTWPLSTAHAGAAGGIASFSGVDNVSPINVSLGQATASSLNHAAPSITTTVANAMLVTVHEYASGRSWTPPAGMTEAVDQASRSASTAGVTLEMNYLLLGAAGATGAKTATASASADTGATVSIALRPAAAAPDHIEIDYPAPPFSTCSATSVTVRACADAACASLYTNGVSVTLSPGGNVVVIPSGSSSGSGTVFQAGAGAATLDAVSVPAELTATTCKNSSTGAFSCSVNFAATALSVSVPNFVSGNTATGSIAGCTAQLPAGANTINFFTAYQNPASGTLQATINATTVATSGPGTAISLNFNGASPISSVTFSLSYPDVGAVGLTAVKASASGSASFTAVPHHFTLSNINCVSGCIATPNPGAANASGARFMKAGNPFSLTVTAFNSNNAATPNFGKETPAESVNLAPAASMPDLPGAVVGNLAGVFGAFSNGVASGNAFTYDEAGIMTLTTTLQDPDAKGYLSIGNQALNPAGTVSGNIGRFIPDHFALANDPASPILTRAALPQATANATGTTAPATVIGVDDTTGFNVGDKVRIPGAGAGGNTFVATVTAVNPAGPTLTLDTAIGTTLIGGEDVIAEWGSYMGEVFNAQFTLSAVDLNENTTQNYQGAYAKLNPTAAGNPLRFGAVNAGTDLTARLDTSLAASGSFVGGLATIVAPLAINRVASPDGPYAAIRIGIAPTTAESDGVIMGAYDLNVGGSNDHTSIMDATVQAATEVRFGRVQFSNAFGSQTSSLQMPVQAQYWSAKSWVLNSNDSLTAIPAASVALSNYRDSKGAAAAWTTTASGPGTLAGGQGSITLSVPTGAPPGTGSVDVAINLGSSGPDQSCLAAHGGTAAGQPWFRSQNGSCAATYDRDPSATASFGVYSPETSRSVHVRELF